MHKLIDYICEELEEIERKAEKGKLSMQEIQYADTLAHMKKNLLKAEEMMGEEYSEASYYARGRGRNARRDSRGRYANTYREGGSNREGGSYRESREGYNRRSYGDGMQEAVSTLYEIMDDLPDNMKMDAQRFVKKLEQM